MFSQVGWMAPADEEIIQVLSSSLWLSTGNISKNSGYTSSWVRSRCSEMTRRRVLDVDASGEPFYKLSPLGEKIANRTIGAKEVRRQTVLLSDYELEDED